jgi:hypothetical protein
MSNQRQLKKILKKQTRKMITSEEKLHFRPAEANTSKIDFQASQKREARIITQMTVLNMSSFHPHRGCQSEVEQTVLFISSLTI